MLRIAVTGASGFIGQHVVAELKSHDCCVVAVTRQAASDAIAYSHLNDVEHIALDIGVQPEHAFERLGAPDILIHLAWSGLPHYCAHHHFEFELVRQYAFLRDMVKAGLRFMLVAGTCLEYGMQDGALSEANRTAPITSYGYAKDALRRQLAFLQREHDFSLAWTRLFYMHGAGQPATALFAQLDHALERGDTAFAMSPGEQLRDYLPVATVAHLLVRLALSGHNSGPVNVCSGVPRSVRSLVEEWLAQRQSTLRLRLGQFDYPDYEPMAFWGKRDKLDALLGRPVLIESSHPGNHL